MLSVGRVGRVSGVRYLGWVFGLGIWVGYLGQVFGPII